jgi:hypothetical protein
VSPPTVHAEVYQLGLTSQIPIEVMRDRSERAANLSTQSSSDRDGRDTWFLNAERGIHSTAALMKIVTIDLSKI